LKTAGRSVGVHADVATHDVGAPMTRAPGAPNLFVVAHADAVDGHGLVAGHPERARPADNAKRETNALL